MKIANARTFGNRSYVTDADISSAISQHVSDVQHMDSALVEKINNIESGATNVTSSTVAGWGYTKVTSDTVSGWGYTKVTAAGVSATASSVVSAIAYTKTEVDSQISAVADKLVNVYTYRGSVDAYSSLPTSGMSTGDIYNVVAADQTHGVKAGDNVAWNGSEWDVLAGTVDLSGYAIASNVASLAYRTVAVKTSAGATATNVVAGSKDATVTVVGGDNITLSADAANGTIAISAVDTTYGVATTGSDGLMGSAMVAKLDSISSNAEVNQNAYQTVAVKSDASATAVNVTAGSKTATITLIGGSNVRIVPDSTNRTVVVNATDTTYSAATSSNDGLMTSAMAVKLAGIESGAEVNQNAYQTITLLASSGATASTNVTANSKTATVKFVAGENMTMAGDAANGTITFGATIPSQKIDFTSANQTGVVAWNSGRTEATFTHTLDCIPNVVVYDSNWELTYVTIQLGSTPNNSTFKMVLDEPVVSSSAWHCIVTYGHHV